MFASVKTEGMVRPFWLLMSYTPTAGSQYREIDTRIGEIYLITSTQSAASPAPSRDANQCSRHAAYLHLIKNHDDAGRLVQAEHFDDLPVESSGTSKTQFQLSQRLICVSASNRPMSRASLARQPKSNGLTKRPKRVVKVGCGKKVIKRHVRLARAS